MKNLTSTMRNSLFAVIVCLIWATPSVCQLPNTHIYCLDMEKFGDQIDLKNAKFLSAHNPLGYNNQPTWVNNNELYIACMTPYDTNQTEILSLSLLTNTLTQVTATRESEYSPTLMPDRKSFSCIRADATRSMTQRLWTYPLDRSNSGRDLLTLHQDVGYHCWLTEKRVALFIVAAKGNYLKLVNTDDQSSIQMQSGVGRSFARTNEGKLLFVQKSTQSWTLKTLDPVSYATETVIETLPLSEDFALLGDGTVLMGSGSRLYRYKLGDPQKQWTDVADLSKFGIFNIKRLTVSREQDKIAIVNDVYQR